MQMIALDLNTRVRFKYAHAQQSRATRPTFQKTEATTAARKAACVRVFVRLRTFRICDACWPPSRRRRAEFVSILNNIYSEYVRVCIVCVCVYFVCNMLLSNNTFPMSRRLYDLT